MTSLNGEKVSIHNNNNHIARSKCHFPHALHSLVTADAVCFDVDSTVIDEEGIDVLAERLGQGQAVAALTKQTMEGGLPFQDALQVRLNLLQHSVHQIHDCLASNTMTPIPFTPGVHTGQGCWNGHSEQI